MTIRRTLIGLTGFLGLALLATVAVQISSAVEAYRRASTLVESNTARRALSEAAAVLAAERSQVYLTLQEALPPEAVVPDLPRETDQALAAAMDRLRELSPYLGDELRVFFDMPRRIRELRENAVSAQKGDQATRARVAEQWFEGMIAAIDTVEALQRDLLAEGQAADPVWTAMIEMETLSSTLLDYIYRNQARLPTLLNVGRRDPNLLDPAQRNAANTELTLRQLRDRLIADDPAVRRHLSELANSYFSSYRPVEITILQAVARDQRPARQPEDWLLEASRVLPWVERLQYDLSQRSAGRLQANLTEAAWSAARWLTLLLCGGAAVAGSIYVIQRRVLFPIEALEHAMLGLAEGKFDTPLPLATRNDEIGAMADALRVFKANAIRRKRLQDERTILHEKLEEAYGQVKADLEAAAAVQAALLPEPGQVNGVGYYGYFKPAHFIAGDTYNVFGLSDGRVIFFLIDVAGHGAPAALVSVASHYSLVQALIARKPLEGLARAVETLNDDWPENMPYFTMVLGEVDPILGKGRMVQAGHPSPLLISRAGMITALGDGGLPIGALSQVPFEEVLFDFNPGDRLFVYSDGLTEAENDSDEAFSEERLHDLILQQLHQNTPDMLSEIERTVRSWCAPRDLDDDLTMLILEAKPAKTGATHT
ncbi:HAMP domain-containing protein (plasmid) [Paracoccus liaowanqingii]|uniref:HAMP domain-containing protein n=1 Tax=Paracoccus liaowanqingii TaxID=2560053 RepID=A0A4Y5SSY6_9RHOB|nr:SpoIIE family protein phosphatase [Paracoccus liaowanqingii]QDA35915.1 HAMP domain-containing protein [Paracoccus liaowanqingii]